MNSKFILCVALALAIAQASAFAKPRLKTLVTVEDEIIRLGDVLDGVESAAELEVSAAPPPGKRATLPVRRIYAVTKRQGIAWRPRGVRSIIVQRLSKIVPHRRLVEVLEREAMELSGSERVKIEFASRNMVIHVPRTAETTIALESFRLDEGTRSFSAIVRAPADDENAARITVKGRVHIVVEAPVLGRAVAIGDVIEESDIVWKDVRLDRVGNGVVTAADDLVGYVPRRRIRPMHPVRSRDVQRPLAFRKGEPVTMKFVRVNLILTMSGRALENGSKGDTIRVRNVRTKKTVEGTVIRAGQINVDSRVDQVSALR